MKALVRLPLPLLFIAATAHAGGREVPKEPRAPAEGLPEPVVYRQLFRHVVALQQAAEALEKQGADASRQRSFYKQNAHLRDEEDAILTEVARQTLAELARQDQEAYRLIRAARAQVPNGRLAAGQLPPGPPSELESMQEERDAITLRGRDRLRQELGDGPFERFSQFVKAKIAPRIRRVPVERRRPAGPRSPTLLPPSVTTPAQ